jgi:hypothetical protein
MAALQREEPVGAGGRTHGIRHQAVVQRGIQRWPERMLCRVKLTLGCCYEVQGPPTATPMLEMADPIFGIRSLNRHPCAGAISGAFQVAGRIQTV